MALAVLIPDDHYFAKLVACVFGSLSCCEPSDADGREVEHAHWSGHADKGVGILTWGDDGCDDEDHDNGVSPVVEQGLWFDEVDEFEEHDDDGEQEREPEGHDH